MYNPSQYINEICPSCHPQSYVMSLAKYAGESEVVEVIEDADASYVEYLYECCKCGARSWVDEQWVKNNAVPAPKTIQQRQEYINHKILQLDNVTDAHKYAKRLARIMWYHKLLTDLEVAAIRKILKGDG